MKSIHDLEDSFSDRTLWLSIYHPCLPTEMYVFTLVRKRGVICATCTCIYNVFTRHLNMECFESAIPAIFLSYAPTFFKPNMLLINHFIIKYKLQGMVTRRSRRWVPLRSTTSLFFNVTLCSLIHFWLGTQKSISALTIFSININFDKVISEIDNVLQKRIV